MDITFAALIGAASLGGLYHLHMKTRQREQELAVMQKAKEFSPGKLLKAFENVEFLAASHMNPENHQEYRIRAFLEGHVDCKNPIQSLLNSSVNLIHRIYYKEELYSDVLKTTSKPTNIIPYTTKMETSATLLYELKDYQTNASCLVHRSMEVNATNILETVAEKTDMKDIDLFDKTLMIMDKVHDIQKAATAAAAPNKNNNNQSKPAEQSVRVLVGYRERELGIRVGSPLTIYGDIIYNLEDKTIRIDKPISYVHEKSHAVKMAKDDILGNKIGKVLLALTFGVSLGYIASSLINSK